MSRSHRRKATGIGPVDGPRLAAYDVLVAVRVDDAYANLVLPQLLRERRIEGRDAAFATELVGGTLRGQRTYDTIIDHLVGRPPDAAVRDALRLGAHQLLSMRVPDHAAVASTVELVRTRVGHKPAGFTNAVLRRIAERDLGAWMDLLDASPGVRHSHPDWVVEELARALDRPEELEPLLRADNTRPLVTLVARPGLSTVEELLAAAEPDSPGAAPVEPGVRRSSLALRRSSLSLRWSSLSLRWSSLSRPSPPWGWCCPPATPATSPPCGRAAPVSRTPGPSWWPSR